MKKTRYWIMFVPIGVKKRWKILATGESEKIWWNVPLRSLALVVEDELGAKTCIWDTLKPPLEN